MGHPIYVCTPYQASRNIQRDLAQSLLKCHEKPHTKEIGADNHAAYLADHLVSVNLTTGLDESMTFLFRLQSLMINPRIHMMHLVEVARVLSATIDPTRAYVTQNTHAIATFRPSMTSCETSSQRESYELFPFESGFMTVRASGASVASLKEMVDVA